MGLKHLPHRLDLFHGARTGRTQREGTSTVPNEAGFRDIPLCMQCARASVSSGCAERLGQARRPSVRLSPLKTMMGPNRSTLSFHPEINLFLLTLLSPILSALSPHPLIAVLA